MEPLAKEAERGLALRAGLLRRREQALFAPPGDTPAQLQALRLDYCEQATGVGDADLLDSTYELRHSLATPGHPAIGTAPEGQAKIDAEVKAATVKSVTQVERTNKCLLDHLLL